VVVGGAALPVDLRASRRPHHGGGPRPISGVAGTGFAPGEGDEAPSDDRSGDKAPRVGAENGLRLPPERVLQRDELFSTRRPADASAFHRLMMAVADEAYC